MLTCSLSCSSILCMKSTALEVIDQSLERMAQDKARTTFNFAWLPEKIGMIIRNTDINSADDLGNTRLHYAAFLTDFDAINRLLAMGADPAKQNNNGQDFLTILELLINQESSARKLALITSYQQLLRAIAQKNVSQRFKDGDTLLHKAVRMQDAPLVIDLFSSIDPNQVNNFGSTPLHSAVAEFIGDPTILNQLLAHGANPNLTTELGNTSLHLAARNFIGNPLTIYRLLERGANPDIKNNDGDTPINIMLQKLNELIKEYTKLKRDKNTPKQRLDEMFDTLNNAALALFDIIQHSKNRNIQDNLGNTPLYHLVILSASKEPEIKDKLKSLIRKLFTSLPAANPNIQNRDGFTALHAAVNQQDPELVELLLKQGANPFIRSYVPRTMKQMREGIPPQPDKTPLDIAVQLAAVTPVSEGRPIDKISADLKKAEVSNPQLAQLTTSQPLGQPEQTTIPREISPLPQESSVQPKKTKSALEQALDLLTQSLEASRTDLLQ